MVLQYKGFNNNWCYEEADTITHAVVWVGKETRDYREGGARYKLKEVNGQDDLSYVKELHDAVDRLIMEETHCADEITYHIDKPFDQMENVVVVTLSDRNKYITRVFESGVYLLNSRGQTVQRLA